MSNTAIRPRLKSELARTLYHTAAAEPILDYHCHLPPQDIAENRKFNNLFEAWLEGDHYKWRAMRTNGVPEEFITGKARSVGKISGLGANGAEHFAQPAAPLDAFGVAALFWHRDAVERAHRPRIWHEANEKLQSHELTTQGILQKFG